MTPAVLVRIDHSTLERRALSVTLLAVFLLFWTPLSASAEKRVALVIGNANYQSVAPLDNPGHDATDMANKLRGLNFEVIEGTDADLSALKGYIKQFSQQLNGADVALFYYSGHAIQVQDTNYIVPVDATLGSELDVDLETLSLGTVLRQMRYKARVNLVFLDACRDNPFLQRLKRGTKNIQATRGLSRIDTNHVGSVIVFATAPGETALDGTGRRNSPFTEAMLRHIDTPGQDIGIMLRKVRGDVIRVTNSSQIPWERSSLTEGFSFASLVVPPPAPESAIGLFKVTGLPANTRLCFYVDGDWLCNSSRPLQVGQVYPVFASAPGYLDWRGQARLDRDGQPLAISLNPQTPLSEQKILTLVAVDQEGVQILIGGSTGVKFQSRTVQVAKDSGIELFFPKLNERDLKALKPTDVLEYQRDALDLAQQRYQASARLTGALVRTSTGSWSSVWRLSRTGLADNTFQLATDSLDEALISVIGDIAKLK